MEKLAIFHLSIFLSKKISYYQKGCSFEDLIYQLNTFFNIGDEKGLLLLLVTLFHID